MIPTNAITPATTAAPIARRRKYSASSDSRDGVRPIRGRPPTRYAAHRRPASRPPTIDVGLIQLDHGSPALPPDGTRPEAMAPATAPMQNGTTTDDAANAAPKLRRSRVRSTALRNAKLDPRNTIPSAASVSGTNSVSVIDANATENAGPEHDQTEDQPHVVRFPDRTDRVVDQRARPFAPLGAAREEVPEPGAEVGAAEERVRRHPEEQHHGGHIRHVHGPRPFRTRR